jgi:hypothetical protein
MRDARSVALSWYQLSMRVREFRWAMVCMLLRELEAGFSKRL